MATGDEFYLMDDRKLVCKADYETAKTRGGTYSFVLNFFNFMQTIVNLPIMTHKVYLIQVKQYKVHWTPSCESSSFGLSYEVPETACYCARSMGRFTSFKPTLITHIKTLLLYVVITACAPQNIIFVTASKNFYKILQTDQFFN